jgi:predicted component of type VI protein secretion system
LIESCFTPLNGDAPAGRDLKQFKISDDDAARKWHGIRATFDDSNNVDWQKVQDDGRSILREASKDLLALWAVLTPIPRVQKYGFQGVSASVRACSRFLSEYWESMFPALPDGLLMRRTILQKLVSRWDDFARQSVPTEADAQAISELADNLVGFEAIVSERIPERTPSTGNLRQLVVGFLRNFPQKIENNLDGQKRSGESQAAPPAESNEATVADQSRQLETSNAGNELEQGFAKANGILRTNPQDALRQFSDLVDRQSTFAGRLRGRVYLAELCLNAGRADVTRQMLSLVDLQPEKITLVEWDPSLCGRFWATLHKAIAAEHAANPTKEVQQKLDDLFDRICRVDARQAVDLKSS